MRRSKLAARSPPPSAMSASSSSPMPPLRATTLAAPPYWRFSRRRRRQQCWRRRGRALPSRGEFTCGVPLLACELTRRRQRRVCKPDACNKVLNALFTLMSLYEHLVLFYHLFLLYQWRSEEVIELRKVYYKDGAYRPLEWVHMTIVILLLHLTCFS
ncbi:hypothetical protein Cni_G10033 [Canna indica]|uniref:Uncharacterized protein n=1 Tax=Canna indica TaxID=4628 RepID=A0AAQ3K3P8_9LILI|nr:hypothetical protein Cni_G10033 [Canna indica]